MPDAPQPIASQALLTERGRPPLVRLSTWVHVVLVLILLASCSGASDVSDLVQGGTGSQVASQDEISDLCRLLGAVAAEQGIDLDQVFGEVGATTQCQDAARGSATP